MKERHFQSIGLSVRFSGQMGGKMEKQILITKKYLLIPVCVEKDVRPVSFSCGNEKIYEFNIPVSDEKAEHYAFHYFASIPVERYMGKKMTVEGEVPKAFLEEICLSDRIPETVEDHPMIHFTANTGWTNDPNGMIYQNGVYHLFFQYNPFDTKWENMCWGHAVSTDLIHWEQKETALYPDQDGTMYSGCGIINEKGLLGLPTDAQLYFYTCSGGRSGWSRGKKFKQKIAYSTDGGKTLQKLEGCIIKHIVEENRDPKVYWHEESKAYYMVLYLDKNDFGIFRSKDLKSWKKSQTITLDKGFECPDLRRIPVEGGSDKWMFWSADGYYYLGDFDGYEFKTDGIRHEAYKTSIPYAAQTFWGTKDVITIPWLRTENKGKLYRSGMGLPKKMTLTETEKGLRLRLSHVEEFLKARVNVHSSCGEGKVFHMMQKESALEVCIHMEEPGDFSLNLCGTTVIYTASCGKLSVGNDTVELDQSANDFSIIADREIIEVTAQNGLIYAVFETEKGKKGGTVTVETSKKADVDIYRVD